MTKRASLSDIGRYADVVGVLHQVDRANAARRRRDAVELCVFVCSVGVLAAAIQLVGI